jgi:hypothetical protein
MGRRHPRPVARHSHRGRRGHRVVRTLAGASDPVGSPFALHNAYRPAAQTGLCVLRLLISNSHSRMRRSRSASRGNAHGSIRRPTGDPIHRDQLVLANPITLAMNTRQVRDRLRPRGIRPLSQP